MQNAVRMKRLPLVYLGLFLVFGACTGEAHDSSGAGALSADFADSDRRAALDNARPGPILCQPRDADDCPEGTVCDPHACVPSCPACDDCNPACVATPILCHPEADDCPNGMVCDPYACAPSCPGCEDCNPACVAKPKPAPCCDIADMPGFNGNPFCFEGASCCGDGTWQCNQGNGQPSCDALGDMCPLTECGGFAGIPCPDGQTCVDFPLDECDPDNGGADCAGVCIDDHACGDDQ